MDFFKTLALNVFLLGIGVYIVCLILKRSIPWFSSNKTLKRLVPLVVLVLSVGGAFIPGVFPESETGPKILYGLFSCFVASYMYSFIKKTVLGQVNLPQLWESEKKEKNDRDTNS